MNLRKFYKEIPKVPLGALIFYLATYLLWQINIIPAPSQVLKVYITNMVYLV